MYLNTETIETDKIILQSLMLEILEDWGVELAGAELNRLATELAEEAIGFLSEDAYLEEDYVEDHLQGELF